MRFLMRFTDMLLVIPGLPCLLSLVTVLGGAVRIRQNSCTYTGHWIPGMDGLRKSRQVQVLSLKERPFVEAAKAAGAGSGTLRFDTYYPNIVGLIYVNLALAVPGAILAEAALSFLGLGDVSVLSWGRMPQPCRDNWLTEDMVVGHPARTIHRPGFCRLRDDRLLTRHTLQPQAETENIETSFWEPGETFKRKAVVTLRNY